MRKYIIILFVLCFFNCQRKNDGILVVRVPEIEMQNNIPTIDLPQEISKPRWFLAHEDFLIFVNETNENILSIFNKKDKTLQTLQDKGRATNEILNINQIGIYSLSPSFSFYVHDDIKKELFIYSLENDKFKLTEIVDFPAFNSFSIDDELILGVPLIPSARYVLNNFSSDVNIEFGNYNEYDPKVKVEDNTLSAGNNVINIKKKRFAWLSLYGESISVFDYGNTNMITEIHNASYRRPLFDLELFRNKGQVMLSSESNISFTSITHSDSHIFALYSGKTIMDFVDLQSAALHGNYVLVFDWDGNYVKKIYSENPVISISYDNSNKILYLLTDNEKYNVACLYI